MGSLGRYMKTSTTIITVPKILLWSHATNTAPITMKNLLFLLLIIEQITNQAGVLTKNYAAFLAILLRFLYLATLQTLDLLHVKTIHLVILFIILAFVRPLFIVAEPAREKLLTLLAFLLASGSIVWTAFSIHLWLLFDCLLNLLHKLLSQIFFLLCCFIF